MNSSEINKSDCRLESWGIVSVVGLIVISFLNAFYKVTFLDVTEFHFLLGFGIYYLFIDSCRSLDLDLT